MTAADDPLAQNAKTWSGRVAGPPCQSCDVNLNQGHRYYQQQDGTVIHYNCKAKHEN
jgi:hypothetical protein